jgi:Type I phosphodiesterase / nucleotide pyrophosphatase
MKTNRLTPTAAHLAIMSALLVCATPAGASTLGSGQVRHVLLLSIDGMHAVDLYNCVHGIDGVAAGAAYCPNLAALSRHAINYVNASSSKPSDSFPGLAALVSGGSPKSTGLYYDVAYDRTLDPPAAIGMGEILYGPSLAVNFALGGWDPGQDPRAPDIIVTPNVGATYSSSTAMIADHGGFAHDDTNVIMLVAHPGFRARTVSNATTTMQVAPTIVKALGLDPAALDAVRAEGTAVLAEVVGELDR